MHSYVSDVGCHIGQFIKFVQTMEKTSKYDVVSCLLIFISWKNEWFWDLEKLEAFIYCVNKKAAPNTVRNKAKSLCLFFDFLKTTKYSKEFIDRMESCDKLLLIFIFINFLKKNA